MSFMSGVLFYKGRKLTLFLYLKITACKTVYNTAALTQEVFMVSCKARTPFYSAVLFNVFYTIVLFLSNNCGDNMSIPHKSRDQIPRDDRDAKEDIKF
jgi:hypothetical protein